MFHLCFTHGDNLLQLNFSLTFEFSLRRIAIWVISTRRRSVNPIAGHSLFLSVDLVFNKKLRTREESFLLDERCEAGVLMFVPCRIKSTLLNFQAAASSSSGWSSWSVMVALFRAWRDEDERRTRDERGKSFFISWQQILSQL